VTELRRALPRMGAIDVWYFDSNTLSAPDVEKLSRTLGPEERTSIDRFRDEALRRRHAVARVMVLSVLGEYLGAPTSAIAFDRSRYGKPFVIAPEAAPTIRFNVSHSDAMTIIAVANGLEVGIDIERIRRDIPVDTIAPSAFTPKELSALSRVSPDDRFPAFFACWTRKEALLKAQGTGLSRSPKEVEVGLGREGESLQTGGWILTALDVASDYAAAVALEGAEIAVDLVPWDPPSSPEA
jgi:4'-phosphopantetheinyl transferase